MDEFDFWTTILCAILILIGGIKGIVDDYKNKGAWWRWVLDCLSIPVAIWLLATLH